MPPNFPVGTHKLPRFCCRKEGKAGRRLDFCPIRLSLQPRLSRLHPPPRRLVAEGETALPLKVSLSSGQRTAKRCPRHPPPHCRSNFRIKPGKAFKEEKATEELLSKTTQAGSRTRCTSPEQNTPPLLLCAPVQNSSFTTPQVPFQTIKGRKLIEWAPSACWTPALY